MNSQLPICQESQLHVNWARKEDLKIEASKVKRSSKVLEIKALAKIMRGNNVVGYYLRDELGAEFAMTSDEIKKVIKCSYTKFFNLKLSSDGKLLHEPDGDRLGLDVPPEVFFKYDNIELNLRMYFDSNRKHVILCNTRTKEFLEFTISLYHDNRAWLIRCCNGNMFDNRKFSFGAVSDVLYRDCNTDVIDEFINKVLSLVRKAKAKTTTLEDDYRAEFEREWNYRFSYLDDYLHGCSEDSEDAFHSLKYLKENCEKYGKTWDVNF